LNLSIITPLLVVTFKFHKPSVKSRTEN
jgi:hypothetical protein